MAFERGIAQQGRYDEWLVTTREKVEKLLDRLSKDELEAEYERLKATVEGERVVDEWGDLSAMTDAAAGETIRRLDEGERASHGKTIGEAWER